MSAKDVELVEEFMRRYDPWSIDAWINLLSPEIEWHLPAESVGGERVIRGVDAFRRYIEHIREGSDPEKGVSLTIEQIVDLGDEVLTLEREVYYGQATGLPMVFCGAGIYRVREGRIVCLRGFPSHEAGLEATGLNRRWPRLRARLRGKADRAK